MYLEPLLLAAAELWRAGKSACSELWRCCTRENAQWLVANGLIVYYFPEVFPVLLEGLRRYFGAVEC